MKKLKKLNSNISQNKTPIKQNQEQPKEQEKELLSKENKTINNGELDSDDLYGGMAPHKDTEEKPIQKNNILNKETPNPAKEKNNQQANGGAVSACHAAIAYSRGEPDGVCGRYVDHKNIR